MTKVADKYGDDISNAADKMPLITYNFPEDEEDSIAKLVELAKACGIGKSDVGTFVLDLDNAVDMNTYMDKTWQGKWNGVWVIYTPMDGGKAVIDSGKKKAKAKKFAEWYASYVVPADGFRYGVVVGDNAGKRFKEDGTEGGGESFVFSLSEKVAGDVKNPYDSPFFYGCEGPADISTASSLAISTEKPKTPDGWIAC